MGSKVIMPKCKDRFCFHWSIASRDCQDGFTLTCKFAQTHVTCYDSVKSPYDKTGLHTATAEVRKNKKYILLLPSYAEHNRLRNKVRDKRRFKK